MCRDTNRRSTERRVISMSANRATGSNDDRCSDTNRKCYRIAICYGLHVQGVLILGQQASREAEINK